MAAHSTLKSIVLVHGGFVDGSGWEGVYDILNSDGYDVTIVQNPTVTLEDDVTVTTCAIAAAWFWLATPTVTSSSPRPGPIPR